MSDASSKRINLERKTKFFIDKINSKGGKPLYELSFEEAREFLNTLQKTSHISIDAQVSDMELFTRMEGTLQVRCVRPKNNNDRLPLIIYLHGGGWILGNEETHDVLIRKLAVLTNSVVLFPKYTLSPETKYPTALNQIYAVLDYVSQNDDEFKCDSDKFVIAGDSAGGNMAAVTAIRAKKENGPKILLQALFYPVTSAEMKTDSYNSFKDGPWLSKKAMEWFFDAYLPDKQKRSDIYVSPLNADIKDLQGLPPALIITAENDVLRDEGEAYARKLDEAGVETTCVRINGTHHDFMMLNDLTETMPAKAAFSIACDIIRQTFEQSAT